MVIAVKTMKLLPGNFLCWKLLTFTLLFLSAPLLAVDLDSDGADASIDLDDTDATIQNVISHASVDFNKTYISVVPGKISDPGIFTGLVSGGTYDFDGGGTGTYTDQHSATGFNWTSVAGKLQLTFDGSGVPQSFDYRLVSELGDMGIASQGLVDTYITSNGDQLVKLSVKRTLADFYLLRQVSGRDDYLVIEDSDFQILDDTQRSALLGSVAATPVSARNTVRESLQVLASVTDGTFVSGNIPGDIAGPFAYLAAGPLPAGLVDDVATFNANNTGSLQITGDSFTWAVVGGDLQLTFSGGVGVTVQRDAGAGDSRLVYAQGLKPGSPNFNSYGYQIPDSSPATTAFVGSFLLSSFAETDPQSYTSNGNHDTSKLLGFRLNSDGSAKRLANGVVENWFWEDPGAGVLSLTARSLGSSQFSNCDLAVTGCDIFLKRSWHPVASTSTRLYLLEYEDSVSGGSVVARTMHPRVHYMTLYTQDLDSDQVSDADEIVSGLNPNNNDSDSDGVLDGVDVYPLISLGGLQDSDSDGAPDSCDQACLNTGMMADTDTEDFVKRFYQQILGREADTAGLNLWVNGLQDGTRSGSDIAFGFIFSQEFLNRTLDDSDFVDVLYRAFFNREPDAGGKSAWLSQLTGGTPRSTVLSGFTGSPEFSNLAATFGISSAHSDVEKFVKRFYQEVLLRDPDAAGFADWVQQLVSKSRSGADIANGFIFSPEFFARNVSNLEFVRILYRAFFDREPDQGGLDSWLLQLSQGVSRQEVLNGFIFATEFANLASSFGIEAVFSASPPASARPVAAVPKSGIWSDNTQSSWGLTIVQLGGKISAAIYTYDTNGFPTWYLSSDCRMSPDGCMAELYEITGGTPVNAIWEGANKSLVPAGSMKLSFTDQDNGTFSFELNGIGGTKSISRNIWSEPSNEQTMTGHWATSGESGWFVSLTQQSDITFVVVYTYDSNGFPTWYIATDCAESTAGCTALLYSITGGETITNDWSDSSLLVTEVGLVEFSFVDENTGTMLITINGQSETKAITKQTIQISK